MRCLVRQTKLVVYRRIIVGKTVPFYNLDPHCEQQKPQTIRCPNYESELSNWRPFLYVVYPWQDVLHILWWGFILLWGTCCFRNTIPACRTPLPKNLVRLSQGILHVARKGQLLGAIKSLKKLSLQNIIIKQPKKPNVWNGQAWF